MSWKQTKWGLLGGAIIAGIVLSSLPTTPQLSRCPEIGRVPGIVVAMIVTTTIIHTLVTSLQADLVHSKRVSTWYSVSSSRRLAVIAIGAMLTAARRLNRSHSRSAPPGESQYSTRLQV